MAGFFNGDLFCFKLTSIAFEMIGNYFKLHIRERTIVSCRKKTVSENSHEKLLPEDVDPLTEKFGLEFFWGFTSAKSGFFGEVLIYGRDS